MLNSAISKIKTEMEQSNNNSYVRVVGEFLLCHLNSNPGSADKIMADGKTIAKSQGDMRKAAEKKKDGNCAVLTDAEGFAVVLEYYGVSGAPILASVPVPTQLPELSKDETSFNIRLEDLL